MEDFNEFCLSRDFVGETASVKELSILINKLDKCFKNDCYNFAETCFVVYQIKVLFDNYYFYHRNNEIYTFDTIMQGFGIGTSESSRLLGCYDKFCILVEYGSGKQACKISDEYYGFSKSKLFELLVIPNEQILLDIKSKVLRADMSVKSIREYVKNYKELQKANKRLENGEESSAQEDSPAELDEEIPMAYDPKKSYEFSYFESKTRSQLLNMIWEKQKAYENLEKQLKKELKK